MDIEEEITCLYNIFIYNWKYEKKKWISLIIPKWIKIFLLQNMILTKAPPSDQIFLQFAKT